MGETITQPPMPAAPAGRSHLSAALSQAPYILMLAGGFGGVVWSSLSATPTPLYWAILTPIFGLLCIAAGWKGAPGRGGRMRLIWTQAAHWIAILLAMLLLFQSGVQATMASQGAEIGLLLLLALGTFLAGVHAGSWRIVAVGFLLGLAVPLLALLQQSALLVIAAALLAVATGAVFVWAAARGKA